MISKKRYEVLMEMRKKYLEKGVEFQTVRVLKNPGDHLLVLGKLTIAHIPFANPDGEGKQHYMVAFALCSPTEDKYSLLEGEIRAAGRLFGPDYRQKRFVVRREDGQSILQMCIPFIIHFSKICGVKKDGTTKGPVKWMVGVKPEQFR